MGIRQLPGFLQDRASPDKVFEMEGLSPHVWGNVAGDTYGWHAHSYDKVLICVKGGITFHGRHGDYRMMAGDRLDIDAGTEHAATVGPGGVECIEAAR